MKHISNGTTTYFTSDSYYLLQLNEITDSPCNEISITLSGYNGLDEISAQYQDYTFHQVNLSIYMNE